MDEATASIDYKTEKLLKKIMVTLFEDKTVITIAHRIKTIIDYDKILVIDEGRIVDFDTPSALRQKKGSIFADLCDKSFI